MSERRGLAVHAGSRPAAVLWDMDGTLVDTEPYWMATEREIVESFGHEWPDHHAHAIVGFDLLDAGAYIAEHGRVPLSPREIVDRLLDGVVTKVHERIPWRPGARRLLGELRDEGIPCALVTMSWRRFVEPVVAALPPGSFDTLVTGDEVRRGKPHPEPYLRAARELGVHPSECIAIEDSPTGVRSALDAGCRVVGVPNVRDIRPQRGVSVIPSLEGVDVDELIDRSPPAPAGRRPPADVATRRRRAAIVAGAVLALIAALVFVVLDRGDEQTAPPPLVPLDAWAPYWTLDATIPELEDRVDSIREVSPFWYVATAADAVGIDPRAPVDATEQFLEIARGSDARIIPSVVDGMAPRAMAAVLADEASRATHVDTLVVFVTSNDFDGLDLDYEQFAFNDGRDTWATTRPNWVAFVTELADRLHAAGKTLTVSIPPVYDDGRTADSGYWVYDHGATAEVVDRIRLMAYDYSTNAAGPIAPLDYVQRSVDGTTSVVDDDTKLVLGIPVYGYNWPVSTTGECPESAEGRTGVTARSVHDLVALRDALPVSDPATGEWSFTYDLEVSDGTTTCTQQRQVHYVDGDGAVDRIHIAREAGLGGVALWALGYEDDQVWALVDGVIRQV